MMCPKDLISGPGGKVAAEVVRPSGLLFLSRLYVIIYGYRPINLTRYFESVYSLFLS